MWMCRILLINYFFKITENKALHISQNMKMVEKLQPEDRYMTAWGLQSKNKRKAEIEVLEAENPPFKTNKVEIKTTELKSDPTKSKKKSLFEQARDVIKGAKAKYSSENKLEIEAPIGPREFDPGQWDEIAIQRKMEKSQLHENFEKVRTELTTKFGYHVTETGLLKGRIRSRPDGHIKEIWVSGHLRKIWVSNVQSGQVEDSSSDAGQEEYPRPSIVLKSGQTGKVKTWFVSIPLVEDMSTRQNFPRFIGNLGTVNEVLALIIDYQNWLDHLAIGPREFDPGQWDEIAILRKMEKKQLHENFEKVRTELTTKFGYQVTEAGLLKGRISAKKSIKKVEDRSAGHIQEIWVSDHVRSGHSNAQSGQALVENSSSEAVQEGYPRPSIVLKSGQTGKVKKWFVSIPLVENMPTRQNFPRFIGNLGTVNEVLALIIDYQNWLDHLLKKRKRKNHLERASNLCNSIPGSSKGQ